ncbi:MAG: SipW-dependent-type signal peptide-containing protein, partial [Phascolarctobacterium sp.]|nr:SipW-dependent-type signal peptide-containing protein [Phascolarctobacterium sp.]
MATKATKRALLSSALALVVCVSMLIGTTFAWFTDSVVSDKNIIKSGNLDIELEYWNGTEWADVEGASDVITNNLFEPGVTEVAYLRLANAGSLALKYQLGINVVSETEGVNAKGDSFKLSDYIQFGVVEGINGETKAYANREAAVAAVTDAKKISAGYSKAASMTAGDELYFALVVYMPESVDNVANHNGTDVPEIALGINVFATQYTFESDSFDEFYDGGAIWQGGVDYSWYDEDATELTIGSAEQLAGFAALVNGTAESLTTFAANSTPIVDSFAGKTITLTSDIDLNGLAWTPIGNWDKAFEGNFDGNGHTIKFTNTVYDGGNYMAAFRFEADATVKNLTIDMSDALSGFAGRF